MAGWGGLSLVLWLHHKLLRVVVRYRRSLRIESVRRLNATTVEIRAARPDGFALRYRAGQFGFFRVLARCCGIAEHPFTISSPPGSQTLAITVKALGDYSAALGSVPVGTKLLCDGPYGRFTPVRDARPYLFVAGGIGITPFLSILGAWDAAGITEPVTLIWSVRNREDLIDGRFLNGLAERHAAFTYVPVLTREQGRRIDREMLAEHVTPDILPQLAAYICGPAALRRTIARALHEMGVSRRAIRYESFSM
jgi:predicted ferric reductase